MNRYSTVLKTKARITLQGRYGIFIGGLLILGLISLILDSLPSSLLGQVPGIPGLLLRFLFSFAISIFTSMLLAGLSRMALLACRGQEISFADLFYAFSSQSDRLLAVKLILGLMTLVLEVPDYLFLWWFNHGFITEFSYYALVLGWLLASLFLSILITMRFALSIYLLIDHEDMSAADSLRRSADLMKGRKGQYLYLRLSFAGMYLLGILSCFVGLLWILPYQETTLVCFYLDVTAREENR